MPRGGSRPGAGRKADPNSARQKALAAKQVKAPADVGFTQGDGMRAPDAPAAWPFGATPVAPPTPVASTEVADEVLDRDALEEVPPDALTFFQSVYKDVKLDPRMRFQAALAALPFEAAKPAPVGKKQAALETAQKRVSKFAPLAPPKLVAANGAKV